MDRIVRAAAADGQIRAFAATTRELVETARVYHNTSPVATAALGRLLSAGAMMGAMMKGEKDLLTLQIRGDGPIGGMTVTANAAAEVKGFVNNPGVMLPATAAGKLDVGGALGHGSLCVIRDLGLKEPYVGQCELQTGEIGDDLTWYFAVSEQVPSSVGLGVLLEKTNTVKQAGGFIIQLLPGTSDEVIDRLEKKLIQADPVTVMLDAGLSPEQILEELIGEFGLTVTETIPARYRCDCSRERIERALISLGRKELEDMIADGEPVEVNCQFCNKKYLVSVEELRDLLESAGTVQEGGCP